MNRSFVGDQWAVLKFVAFFLTLWMLSCGLLTIPVILFSKWLGLERYAPTANTAVSFIGAVALVAPVDNWLLKRRLAKRRCEETKVGIGDAQQP